jgi:hypothetical protein
LSLPHLPQFLFSSRTENVLKHPSTLKFMKLSFQRAIICMNRFRTRELCQFYSGDAICPRLISNCAALNGFAISHCTGLQNWWFLMRLKEGRFEGASEY